MVTTRAQLISSALGSPRLGYSPKVPLSSSLFTAVNICWTFSLLRDDGVLLLRRWAAPVTPRLCLQRSLSQACDRGSSWGVKTGFAPALYDREVKRQPPPFSKKASNHEQTLIGEQEMEPVLRWQNSDPANKLTDPAMPTPPPLAPQEQGTGHQSREGREELLTTVYRYIRRPQWKQRRNPSHPHPRPQKQAADRTPPAPSLPPASELPHAENRPIVHIEQSLSVHR